MAQLREGISILLDSDESDPIGARQQERLSLLFMPAVILSTLGTVAWPIASVVRTASEKPEAAQNQQYRRECYQLVDDIFRRTALRDAVRFG